MRIAVFGAGAIGGHIAFRLVRGGAEVSVIARGAYLDAIRARGITVHARDVSDSVRMAATDDPRDLGVQDAVITTAKAHSLPGIGRAIHPLLGPETPVAFVVNGIPWWYFHRHGGAHDGRRLERLDPEGALWDGMGVARAIGGVVYSACTVVEPGVIHVENPTSRVILGEPDGTISARAEAIAAALRAGGMASEVTPAIRLAVWEKLAGNMGNGPLAILAGRAMRDYMAQPAIHAAAVRAMEECHAIARAWGHEVKADPAKRAAANAASAHKPSILQDLEAGKPMEVDAQLVVPLELARLAGVETPTLDLTIALAVERARAAGLYAG
ncbi:2-dehydropantoate 2-reductase [Elioraea sp.]|uniref:ketopantoate reductase family protein n=1 Tax=Elioraea sp. TaxID=2185103 RepID=UPI00307ED884